MRKFIIILVFLISINSTSQEIIGRRYTLLDELVFNNDEHIKLVKDKYTLYENLPESERLKIDKKLLLVKEGLANEVKLTDIDGNEITITSDLLKLKDVTKIIALKYNTTPDFILNYKIDRFKGNVLFEKNKIYVNPWNYRAKGIKDDENETYYKLKDGQTAKLKFKELTLTTFTMPLKIRFGGKPNVTKIKVDEQTMQNISVDTLNNIDATFSTGFNVALYFGQSIGKTNLHHRKKIGNIVTTHKHTFGGFIGTSSETLSTSNTDGTLIEKDFKDRTIGLLSLGCGYIYSRNKFGIGVFLGWDLGVGELANIWDYNARPYLGIGIGFDIFKVQP